MAIGYRDSDGAPINLGAVHSAGPTEKLSILDIAWAAGIYEGEGHVKIDWGRKDSNSYTQTACVTQKDIWLLERLKAKFGGSIYLKRAHGVGGECRVWRIHGTRARGFLMTIYSFLSPRRQEQIRKLGFLNTEIKYVVVRNQKSISGDSLRT